MSKFFLFLFFVSLFLSSSAQGWITSVPLKLNPSINTGKNELSPIFYVDSSTMYFTRSSESKSYKGFLDQDIWVSKQEKVGGWSGAESVKELNNKLNNSVLGFNSKGDRVYVLDSYVKDKSFVNGIACSELVDGVWGEPKSLPIEGLLIDGDFCGFTINKEENVIVMSYKGPLSIGEEDLYVSFRQEEEAWSVPVHLGEQINSPGFEISPFLTYDSDTLFFATNGRIGVGDSDVFFSLRLDNTWQNWSEPKNLGAPINSPSFDAYYQSVGNRVFWTSDRDSLTGNDIYYVQKIKPPKLKVDVTDIKGVTVFKGKDGSVDISVSGGVEPYTYVWSNGAVTKSLENVPDGEYVVEVTDAVDQKVVLKAIVSTPKIDEGKDLAVLFDPPVVIYYDLDKFSLTNESQKSLDRVVEVLNDNPIVKIEIRSYTDCQGEEDYNLRLSNERADATLGYLKGKVVNPERLLSKGFGESLLVIDCGCDEKTCSEEEHQMNRRTEFIVLE